MWATGSPEGTMFPRQSQTRGGSWDAEPWQSEVLGPKLGLQIQQQREDKATACQLKEKKKQKTEALVRSQKEPASQEIQGKVG